MSLTASLFKGSAADHWYLLLHVPTSDNSRNLWRVSKPCSIGQWLNMTIKGCAEFGTHWIGNMFCNRFTSPAYTNLHSSGCLDGIHDHNILFISLFRYIYFILCIWAFYLHLCTKSMLVLEEIEKREFSTLLWILWNRVKDYWELPCGFSVRAISILNHRAITPSLYISLYA